jgi:hypothetical protein
MLLGTLRLLALPWASHDQTSTFVTNVTENYYSSEGSDTELFTPVILKSYTY